MKAIVLSGGSGTRLWPVSRKNHPKQLQPFIGKETLLEMTLKRLLRFLKKEDIYLAIGSSQYSMIKKQVAKFGIKNFSIEPERKDTAAAIGLAATMIHKKHPKEIVFTANTDHYISPDKTYSRFIKLAGRTIKENPAHTVLIGINPTYPDTGLGYIKMGSQKAVYGKDEVFNAEKFVEKPDLKTAQKFLRQWEYLWNPAMFFWRADHLLSLYKKHIPNIYKILMKIQDSLGRPNEHKVLKTEFHKIKPISIDYGIMEKLKKMLVVPADFIWQDIGHWRSIKDVLSKTETDNVIKGKHIGIDTKGNLIYSLAGKLIATSGVENMMIVDTKDALLVCHKDKAQDVKKIVEQIEKQRKYQYLQ
ncbi:NTP transferase domain-containing protein [Patescibacteria group bacterium]|nr:NTP transferase domain-containing protein [Patescibacteria group bacterium]MBU1890823.1 NTP transferase domain-containing protein [Patescibacteria group bacterium]